MNLRKLLDDLEYGNRNAQYVLHMALLVLNELTPEVVIKRFGTYGGECMNDYQSEKFAR